MGKINEFIDKLLGRNQDDDYFDDDEYLDDDEYFGDDYDDEPAPAPRAAKQTRARDNVNTTTSRRRSRRAEDESYDDYEPAKPRIFRKPAAQTATRDNSSEMAVIKPNSMEDSKDISDYLRDDMAVVLNLEGIRPELAQRIIDFTCGAAYSMDGDLQMVSKFIFIATPPVVTLSGDSQNILNPQRDSGSSSRVANGVDLPIR